MEIFRLDWNKKEMGGLSVGGVARLYLSLVGDMRGEAAIVDNDDDDGPSGSISRDKNGFLSVVLVVI